MWPLLSLNDTLIAAPLLVGAERLMNEQLKIMIEQPAVQVETNVIADAEFVELRDPANLTFEIEKTDAATKSIADDCVMIVTSPNPVMCTVEEIRI